MTKKMCLALARKWDSASDTDIVWAKSARGVWQEGGAKKIRGITVFLYSPPLGGVRPEKKYPTPICKKVSQPQFFPKEHH